MGASGEAQKAASLLKLPPGAHVLNLGCGPGRHTVELASLGYRVTGVDRTLAYFAHAKQRAADAGVQANFCRTACFLSGARRLSTVLSIFSTFGYFENRADDLRVMTNVCMPLRPGARVLVDLVGKESLADLPRKDWRALGPQRFWFGEPRGLAWLGKGTCAMKVRG